MLTRIQNQWNLNLFWNWQNIGYIFGVAAVYCCMRHMCYRLKRTAQITWMEASELLQNRNKCSREGGRTGPHCWLSLSIPMKPLSCFLSASPPCRVEKVDGCYRCQWAVGEWQMAGGINVILELISWKMSGSGHTVLPLWGTALGQEHPSLPSNFCGPWRTQGALVSLYVTVPTARTDSFTSTLRTDGSGAVSGQSGSSW